jgi:hypothetical protein
MPMRVRRAATDSDEAVCAGDSAIRVRGDMVDVVSTGRWRLVGQ